MKLQRMLPLAALLGVILLGLTAPLSGYAVEDVSIDIPGYWDSYAESDPSCTGNYLYIDYNIYATATVDDDPNPEGEGDNFVVVIVDGSGNVIDLDTQSEPLGTFDLWDAIDPGLGDFSAPVSRPFTLIVYDTPYIPAAYFHTALENTFETYNWTLANGVEIARMTLDPSFAPPCDQLPLAVLPAGVCINVPAGSVVGELPNSTQAYWSPGNVSPGLFVNPGTYWVIGQDESGQYLKIILACQYLWVPIDSMQPSYQAPQNGTPLPTRTVS